MADGIKSGDRMLLGPCARPGTDGDWWREQHVFCTGSHHLGPDFLIYCSCECHVVAVKTVTVP